MKFKSLLFSVLATTLMLTGCQKEATKDPYITISPKSLSFEREGQPQTITLETNRDWEAESVPGWVTLSQKEGTATSPLSIIVAVASNPEGADERDCEIVFSTASKRTTLTIHQDGKAIVPGDGSFANPYRAKEALKIASGLESGETVPDVYVKGIVSKIEEIDTTKYYNAKYYISNDGTQSDQLYIYAGRYFDGGKFTSKSQLKEGDAVVLFGTLKKTYDPELYPCHIVSKNGETPQTTVIPLDNAGFEDWEDDAKPAYWKEVNSNADISKESGEVHSGSYSVRVYNASDTAKSTSNQRLMSRVYKLKAGTYSFGTYAKGEEGKEGVIRLGWAKVALDGSVATEDYNYTLSATQTGAEWKKYSSSFTLNETTRVSVMIVSDKTGAGKAFYADDAELSTYDGGIDDTPDPAIYIDKSELTCTPDASSYTVKVTSTVPWTVTGVPEWITVDKTSGTGNGEVELTIAENTGAKREATIKFAGTSPADVAVLDVKQAAAGTMANLLVNPGFEEWVDAKKPTAWKEITTSGDATTAQEATEVHSGSYSVKINNIKSGNRRLTTKAYNLKAGKYTFSAYAKGVGLARVGWAKVDAEGKPDGYKYGDDATPAGEDWTKRSVEFELTSTTKVILIIAAWKETESTFFYADDAELVTEDGGIDPE